MTETIDWAPYANDGDVHRCMVPKGMLLSLTTDDIPGAQYAPTIRKYLHPPIGDKMYPDSWLPQDLYEKKRPSRRLITDRIVNPLDPQYKIPQGENLIPAGDLIFSKRLTDIMDVSDIPGAKPKTLYKGPVKVRIEDIVFDKRSHPAKWTRERLRCSVGTGLDLFDINIGKKRFGFDRDPRSNPLEPLYPTEIEENAEQKFKRLKKKTIPPRKRFWHSGDPVIDKVMEKMYWKPNQLPAACNRYDLERTDRVSYEHLRASLEEFGVKFTDEEFKRLIPYADEEGSGSVAYFKFANALRLPSGLEKIVTKRLGQEQWEGIYGNMGQGLQVLVDSHGRGKKQIHLEDAYHLVDIITGETLLKKGVSAVPPREMLCLSYMEQLAVEAHTKRDLCFRSFMPQPPSSTKRLLPLIVADSSSQPAPGEASGSAEQPAEATVSTEATVNSVPVIVPPVIAPPTISDASPKKSVLISPKKSVVVPTEAKVESVAQAQEVPAGAPQVAIEQHKPDDLKLPVLARKSMAPPGGFDGMPTFETMYQQARSRKLSPPNFKKRIRQEQRNAEIESVLYLG